MAGDPRMRACDADRDRAAAVLREHVVAGRLTLEEFNERLDQAYAAKTLGELDEVGVDLPAVDLSRFPSRLPARFEGNSPLPGRRTPGSVTAGSGRFSPAWRAAWGSWLAVSLFFFVIWLISGAGGGLWFLWVAGPLGALLLGRWIMGVPARGDSRSARTRRG